MAKRELTTKKPVLTEELVSEEPKFDISEETEEVVEQITGIVTGCRQLNIRKKPSTKSDVVCVVPEMSKLLVDKEKSNKEWYSVCTETGFEGFCMKQYVTIQ